MSDDFTQNLLPASFLGIPFPVSAWSDAGSHDAKVHKKADRDGGRIELIGSNPRQFHLTIPLYNGLVAGSSESWTKLFPETYTDLLAAFEKRQRGYLVHPIFGSLYCKPLNWSATYDAQRRNGVTLEVNFAETLEDDDESVVTASKFGVAAAALTDLQAMVAPLDLEEMDWASFEDTLRSLQGITDGAQLLADSVTGKIANMGAAIDRFGESVERLGGADSLDSGGENVGTILTALDKIKEALLEAQGVIASGSRPKAARVLEGQQSWGQIATTTKNTVTELIGLNPAIVGGASIPAGTLIFYYTDK